LEVQRCVWEAEEGYLGIQMLKILGGVTADDNVDEREVLLGEG